MIKIVSILMLIFLLAACEDIYNPKMEVQETVLVVDARIMYGNDDNTIKLNLSKGFNETSAIYPEITGAEVSLIDNDNNENILPEVSGGMYHVNFPLDIRKNYKLRINYNGDIFESEYETVPEIPELDSIYGFPEIKVLAQGGVDNVNDFRRNPGVMLYADIDKNENSKYYRFDARKTYQYVFYIPDPLFGEFTIYSWDTFSPFQESFNVASPAEYSASEHIEKHPLYFMEKTIEGGRELEFIGREGYLFTFMGWILFLYQYSISEKAYHFYKDVNGILEASGRLFDPLYVQARNNLTCVSDSEKQVLGSFEISSFREYRYYVRFISEGMGYLIKPIPYFYDIPEEGNLLEQIPEFWETPNRTNYP